ncbi:hypothetical protein V2J09_018908 [Rumex salicifolius]
MDGGVRSWLTTLMANPRLRGKELVVALAGITLIVFTITSLSDFSSKDSDFNFQPDLVDLTLLRNAKAKGAFCLDGSLPAYHFRKGFGSGSSSWVLHIEGGGWCDTVESCSSRKESSLGSSVYMDKVIFSGILSSDPALNPDFFNWNKVKIRYCDGASLAGHPENELHNGTNLFFRGQLIWEVVMDELLAIGMSSARQALLSGCSAGGLAAMIHCDDFRDIMPKNANVKCLADASFFLDENDISGKPTMRSFYQRIVHLQGVAKSLPKDCVAKMDPSECLFPKELIKSIQTPIFLVNPAYDFWQIQNVLVPAETASSGNWFKCRRNIQSCGPTEMKVLQGFRDSLLKAVSEFEKHKEWGMFINSCFIHCQTWMNTWHGPSSPKIENRTIAEYVGDWYFDRQIVKLIDCPFPCNPTCLNMDFSRPR